MNPALTAVGLLFICAVVATLVVGVIAGSGLVILRLIHSHDQTRSAASRAADRVRWWRLGLGAGVTTYAAFLAMLVMVPGFPGEPRSFLPLVPFAVYVGAILGFAAAVFFLLTVSRSRSLAG